jgi:hypothetical protein
MDFFSIVFSVIRDPFAIGLFSSLGLVLVSTYWVFRSPTSSRANPT